MILTISQGALQRAMQTTSKAVSNDATNPLLGGVLITADDKVTFQSTDLTTSIRHEAKAVVEEPGSVVLPSKLLTSAVKNMPDKPVKIEADASGAKIRCGTQRLRLNVIPASDFPEFPEVEPEASVTIPTAYLASMADGAVRVTSRDKARPVLAGVLLSVADGSMTMVATDAYRLAVAQAKVEAEGSIEAIIPGSALKDALSAPGIGEDVTVSASQSQVCISSGDTTYVTRRIEGQFPKWRALLPNEVKTSATFVPETLAEALKRVSVVAVSNPSVRVSVGDDEVGLFAMSPDQGESTERVDASVEGDPMTIGLNYHFLLDGVSSMSVEARMDLVDPMQPAVLRSYGAIDRTYLLMPVRQ